MGQVHASRGCLPPLSPALRSERWIVAELARRTLGTKDGLPWSQWADDTAAVRAVIGRVVPGFAPYEERLAGDDLELPIPPRERVFGTASGRARFTVQEPTPLPVAAGQLVLTSVRSHDQFNTAVFGLGDRYRGVSCERQVLFMSSLDMEDRGIAAEDAVEVVSQSLGRELISSPLHAVPYNLPRGAVAAYFPEANVSVPADVVDPESGTPAFKSVVVTVRRVAGRDYS